MNTKHQSRVSLEHKILGQCIALIHSSGDQGIKRGILMVKAGVKLSQMYPVHSILKDLEDIEWIKTDSTYRSMRNQPST